MRIRQILSTAAAAFVAAGFLAAGQASAHAALVKSNPAPKAVVPAPKVISLTFSEKLTPAFSGFDLAKGNGQATKMKTTVASDQMTLTGVPNSPLAAGTYTIKWRATAADDGHKTAGTYAFTVK